MGYVHPIYGHPSEKIWESLNIIESWDQTFPKIWIKQTGTPGTPGTPQFSGYGSLVFMMFGEAVQPWKSPWKIHPPEKEPPTHPPRSMASGSDLQSNENKAWVFFSAELTNPKPPKKVHFWTS